jgi:biopolymer transport protein ExbB/TolQ
VNVEEVIFSVTEALRYPVLFGSVLAFLVAVAEAGSLTAELWRRRKRSLFRLERTVEVAQEALARGDAAGALGSLQMSAYSRPMAEAMRAIVQLRDEPRGADRIAKALNEYDYLSIRRLERTRILVRFGPALGLMGTLIPLSPALAGLASGDIETLSDNLRIAFGVTVAGLLVGAIAFAVSLVRDRVYGQDFSDVEYVMTALAPDAAEVPA